MTAFDAPWSADAESDAPLCRTRACADLGIRAVDRFGWCAECLAGLQEDEAERRADARREGMP